jgi:hypothetical protein
MAAYGYHMPVDKEAITTTTERVVVVEAQRAAQELEVPGRVTERVHWEELMAVPRPEMEGQEE